jgi:hypothetical protein
MQFKLPRIGVAALVALGLAACSGQSTVPSAAPQALSPDAASLRLSMPAVLDDAAIANATSPCKVKGFWYFKGTCIASPVKNSAAKVTLDAYKGLGLTLGLSKSNANNATFILGEGTSSADITGTFKNTKFPDYGTVPCVTLQGKTAKCIGKAFLYLLVANTSKNTVTFAGLPSATITNTGKFPGTKQCGVAGLGFTSSGVAAGWFLLPSNAKPAGNKIAFPAQTSQFTFSAGSFTVLGFTCK